MQRLGNIVNSNKFKIQVYFTLTQYMILSNRNAIHKWYVIFNNGIKILQNDKHKIIAHRNYSCIIAIKHVFIFPTITANAGIMLFNLHFNAFLKRKKILLIEN